MTTATIRSLLGRRALHSIAPDASARDAAKLMAQGNVGAVVVLDDSKLAGIVSERDIICRAVAQDRPLDGTTVAEIMTADPDTVDVDAAVSAAIAKKLGDRFRHLPVLQGNTVVGLLSFRDIPAEYLMLFERFREMSSARADDGVRG